jgi:hypothetical protein
LNSDRIYYSSVAAFNLLVMVVGFWAYITTGHGAGGRVIAPAIAMTVLVHGVAIMAWYVLSLVQSVLITVKKRKVHMTLGWVALGLAPLIAVSGALVAVRSAQAAHDFRFFGMPYKSDFLLVMLTEVTAFALLVLAGVQNRKRPLIHRTLMLTASLSLLLGATTRIPWLLAPFGGEDSTAAFFGPVFVYGAILLVVNSLRQRTFDHRFATSFGALALVYLGARLLGATETWHHMAAMLLN